MTNHSMKKTIAICCATLRELSVLEPMDAICEKANELGYCTQIFQSFEEFYGDKEIYEGEESVFDLIDYEKICGMIIFGERLKDQTIIDDLVGKAKAHKLPVVSIDRELEGCFNVNFEYADAFEEIVRHIIEYHKMSKIFVMAGMRDNSFTEDRLNVVKKVMEEKGLSLRDEDIAYGQFWDMPTKEAMDAFFATGREMPDAFIAMNDAMATVIIEEVQKRGYRVPEDVVVTGFDGTYIAENFVPKITTAKQQFDEAGQKAVSIIDEYVQGVRTDCYDANIPFKMNTRQSCGCHGIDMSGVTYNIRDLYSGFENSKRFAAYMDEMTRRMTSRGGLDGFADEATGYSGFVDAHHRILICLDKDYLKIDEDYCKYTLHLDLNKGIHRGSDVQERENGVTAAKDMVVVVDTVWDPQCSYKGQDFRKLELCPDLEELQTRLKNIVIVPVHSGENIYGHMVLDYIPGNRDVYKTKMYANNISNMLHIIQQQKMLANTNRQLTLVKNQLEKMYITDPMTGLLNRRGFFQRYEELRSRRKDGIATLISADLDDLKIINDNYGHQEGDFAIKSLGEALTEVVNQNGISARFGGDEFVALLFDAPMDKYINEILLEQVLMILDAKKIAGAKEYRLCCSLGAVQFPWDEDSDVEAIINGSDKLLYEMKRKHHEGDNDRRGRR